MKKARHILQESTCTRKSNSWRQENVVARSEGRGDGELLFNGHELLFGKTKKFRRWMVVMVAPHCEHA